MYRTTLSSPLGTITLASDGTALTGLWLEGQKYFAATMGQQIEEWNDLPVFRQAAAWLDAYFSKKPFPAFPPLAPPGQSLPPGGVEAAADDPLRPDHHLWCLGHESAGRGNLCLGPSGRRCRGP